MKEKYTRKLQRIGKYSYALVIPKEIIDKLGWRERQKIDLEFDFAKKQGILKDWKK